MHYGMAAMFEPTLVSPLSELPTVYVGKTKLETRVLVGETRMPFRHLPL